MKRHIREFAESRIAKRASDFVILDKLRETKRNIGRVKAFSSGETSVPKTSFKTKIWRLIFSLL